MTALLERIAIIWCRHMHGSITRPVGSFYVCLDCGKQYAVPWARAEEIPVGCHVQEGM